MLGRWSCCLRWPIKFPSLKFLTLTREIQSNSTCMLKMRRAPVSLPLSTIPPRILRNIMLKVRWGKYILSSFVVLGSSDVNQYCSVERREGCNQQIGFDSIKSVGQAEAGDGEVFILHSSPSRCDGLQGRQGQLHLRQSSSFHQPSRHHSQRWGILCLLHPRTLHHLHIQEKGWCRYNGTLGQLSHKILLREKIPSLIEFYQMETSLMWIINILLSDRKFLLADCQS